MFFIQTHHHQIIHHFISEIDVARYKASLHKESGSWLTVFPSKIIGKLLDDNAFRISMALLLGCDICATHRCICGWLVDKTWIPGLSCVKSARRHYRHYNLNDIIKRAFPSAEIPSRLESQGLCREGGKHPDGMTLVPRTNDQTLPNLWPNTLQIGRGTITNL